MSKSAKKAGISWRLSFHEASHAVMAHIICGEESIRFVSASCGSGAVVLHEKFRHSTNDLLRLPITIAGTLGEVLYAEVSESERTASFFAEDDRNLIAEIISYNFFLPDNYLEKQEKRVVQCLKKRFVKAAIRDVADLLYEKPYRLAYVKKSIRGSLVHAAIDNSFAASALSARSTVENLCDSARAVIFTAHVEDVMFRRGSTQ